jgi:steroid delta-isomerase-like uncharacterized protein
MIAWAPGHTITWRWLMTDPKELVDRGLEAWRARDADAFSALYGQDSTISAPGGMELSGPDGAKMFMAGWNAAFPDNDIEVTSDHVCGSVVVQEGVFFGTHTGDLVTPDGQVIPATGKSVKAPYVDVFEVEGDIVKHERLYFDRLELLTQLGVVPEPATATAS